MEPIDLDLDESYDSTPFRSRSNTWPLPRPDLIDSFACSSNNSVSIKQEIIDEVNEPLSIGANDVIGNNLTIKNEPVIPTTTHEPGTLDQASNGQPGGQKKNTSRRNAWGNMSYADLITQAIQGSPEKRLTLSQIYDWMVQNVPYFKDKGDSNSSAGWKVSSTDKRSVSMYMGLSLILSYVTRFRSLSLILSLSPSLSSTRVWSLSF